MIDKAFEIYAKRNHKIGYTTPEIDEIKESGFFEQAKCELMRSEDNEYRSYVEKEAAALGLIKQQYLPFESFRFDSKEAMQTTSFVSGSRGVGKSDIAMYTVDLLNKEGVISVVFDPSPDWKERSSIDQYLIVQPHSILPIPQNSTIFDISRLTPMQVQKCVERFCKKLFEFQLNSNKRFYLVFEESQIFFPLNALRSKKTQNSMRILTVGRNVNVSVCAISQFPALVDKELIKHSGQMWIGYSAEPNTLQYWRGILGDYTDRLKELKNGQFLYYHRNKINLTEIEPFDNYTPKRLISIPEPQPIQQLKPRQSTKVSLSGIALLLIWLVILWIALR